MQRKRLPTRYPLQRFLMLSLLFVVGIITQTLLSDPHLSRSLIEAEQSNVSNLGRVSLAIVVSPDAGFASDKLLGVQIQTPSRRMNIGSSLRLESFGVFVSGSVPIDAFWTERKQGNNEAVITGCEGARDDCTVKGVRPGAMKVTASAEGFRDTATIAVTGKDGKVFSDAVPDWASSAVHRLFDTGIIQGYDDGRFGAADTLTHGQVVTLFHRFLSDAKVVQPAVCVPPFAPDHYAVRGYCQFAAKSWLDSRKPFAPDIAVTRGETARYVRSIFEDKAVTARLGSKVKKQAAPTFTDVPSHHAAYADIATAGALGLMVGHPDGHFGVDEVLNRAEAAMLIDRARELLSM